VGHLQHATFGDRSQQWCKSDKTGNLFNTEDKQGKKQKEGALDWLLKRGFKADIQNISRINYMVGGLLLTLIILFSFQGETILNNPLHILLIAVPLVLQTVLIFFVAYGWAKWWKLPHDVAAPAGMIGASNFFELAVAVAISLFGLQSGAALATVVGVLVEVPVMLMLVRIANNTRSWFPATK